MHSRSNVTKSIKETDNQVSLEVVSFGSILTVFSAFTNKKHRKKKHKSHLNLQRITISYTRSQLPDHWAMLPLDNLLGKINALNALFPVLHPV